MPRATLIFGILLLVFLPSGRLVGYFEGLTFDQASPYSLILGLVFFVLIIGYPVSLLYAILLILRNSNKVRNLLKLSIIPVLIYGTYWLPIPSFIDGLKEAVNRKLERERLIEFAAQAKAIPGYNDRRLRWIKIPGLFHVDRGESFPELQALVDVYPEALTMNQTTSPRISISSDKVEIMYGGALPGHWGYAIVDDDKCPVVRRPGNTCQRVYKNVWVFVTD